MYDEVLNEEEYNIIGGGLYKVKNCFNNIGSRLLYDEVLVEVEKGDVKNIMLIFFIFFFLINN